MLLHM